MYYSRNSQKNRRLGNVGARLTNVRVASARARMHNQMFARQAAAAVGEIYAPRPFVLPSTIKRQKTLDAQVKALIAAKKRDAADVTRSSGGTGTTLISCLTSTTDFAVAPSGTGLIDMDGDECRINSVRMKGELSIPAALDLDPVGNKAVWVRKLVVWFYKPLLIASAAGTLPPITEVLISDAISSLPVTAAANGGRFVILSDKKWCLGDNTFQAATALGHSRVSGRSSQFYDYFVKVGKMCKFAAPSASGASAGGHYDSDANPGRVDRGLLVCYTQVSVTGGQNVAITGFTRLNYTG